MSIKSRYEEAKQMYAAIGVDTDKAIEILKNVPISMHCWQGDDVKGFDQDGPLTGGIQATGNYPGKAMTPEQLMADMDKTVLDCINMSGLLKIRTTKEFGESTVSKIMELVENSSSNKADTEQFTVTLSSNPEDGGTTTGEGTYDANTEVTVEAVSNAGYTFTNWTEAGNVVFGDANYMFDITKNRTLVANFEATAAIGPNNPDFGSAADFSILT